MIGMGFSFFWFAALLPHCCRFPAGRLRGAGRDSEEGLVFFRELPRDFERGVDDEDDDRTPVHVASLYAVLAVLMDSA